MSGVPQVFGMIAELAIASGAPLPLSVVEGAYEIQVDARWKVAINAHDTPVTWAGGEVPPYSAAIEYNGWPAGFVNGHGGVIAAGECANEDTLIEALTAALAARDGGAKA